MREVTYKIAQPPLYQIKKGQEADYAYSDREKDEILAKVWKRMQDNHSALQGLGEMNPEQLLGNNYGSQESCIASKTR